MFKLKQLQSRRATLRTLLGVGGAAFFVPAWNETIEAADTLTCVSQTPTVTEGPYWVDEKLFRSDIRTDPSTGVARAGIPLALTINVQNFTGGCSVLAGAYVDIWHCDARGIYSDESSYNPGGGTGVVTTTGQKFLRGYQITDANGQVKFTTIYPGWYMGRTIHIHVRVRTYSGSTILSNFVTQIFFDDTVSNTVLATSAYSRSTGRDTTNSNDMVYQTANKERMLATVTGDNNNGYAATITIGAGFEAAALSTPAISAGGLTNALSGAAGLSPGSWASIYGNNFAVAERVLASSDIVNNTIPTSLGGVSVKIDGKSAFVDYVSATQINVLVPDDTTTGSVPVVVSNSAGTSNMVNATMQTALPGLATLANYVRAVRYPDGAIVNGTGAAEPGYLTVASAKAGDILSLFGTGFGPASGAPAVGAVFTGSYPANNPVTVSIGGAVTQVLWTGLVAPGLYQINIIVPNVGGGDQAVVASVMGASTQSGALLKIT
ncbi:MAG TPA: hypothetical protein VKE70_16735 [Candidatus Solibacter sp.]|nr:hypothetical protein [Candidatus Solibacter sp.]